MKFKSIGRAVLATGMSLAIGFGATACSRDYTVAYVYATSQQSNEVSAYAVDYQSGALTQINGSPFTGPGEKPVALVPAPNGKFLYVINNFDSSVTEFAYGVTPWFEAGVYLPLYANSENGGWTYNGFKLRALLSCSRNNSGFARCSITSSIST